MAKKKSEITFTEIGASVEKEAKERKKLTKLLKKYPDMGTTTTYEVLPFDPDKAGKYDILIINRETDDMITSLGITKDRAQDIQDMLLDALRTQKKATEAIESLDGMLLHSNEVFFMAYTMGSVIADTKHYNRQLNKR
jgi:hypothetical protein